MRNLFLDDCSDRDRKECARCSFNCASTHLRTHELPRSNVAGAFASAGISYLYSPKSDRNGTGLVGMTMRAAEAKGRILNFLPIIRIYRSRGLAARPEVCPTVADVGRISDRGPEFQRS
jgi:hypothetical protein